MHVKSSSSLALSLALIACSGGGSGTAATASRSDSAGAAALALSKAVKVTGGKVDPGNLPAASDQRVKLLPQDSDPIEPGGTTLMPLDVDNPDEATNPIEAVLMQFQGASDHIEAPASASTSGPGALNIELLVAGDVCKTLCDRTFTLTIEEALMLKDGTVGAHAKHDVMLDCSKKGDSSLCASTKGSSATKVADAGSRKGAAGAGTVGRSDAGGMSIRLPDGGFGFLDGSINFGDGAINFGDAGILYGDGGIGVGEGGISQFPCTSGGIIAIEKVCDGKMDCSDGFDEMICVPCADGTGKYSPYQQCDGKQACADGSDEMGCTFMCTNGQQVPNTKICDGKNDCSDGSDEAPCQFQCGDGTTVSTTKVCDGKADCKNGADEAKPMCP